MSRFRNVAPLAAAALVAAHGAPAVAQQAEPAPAVAIRVATFNIEDLRAHELTGDGSERARRAAEIIQRIRPNIILINEIAYDMPGAPDFDPDAEPGRNAALFAKLLETPQAQGLEPMTMRAWTDVPNTGRASGYDLDRDGRAITDIPPQPVPPADGGPVPQTAAGRAYGNDCWGFGTFPGQYGMALLVDARLEIDADYIRTFRLFPWSFMPGSLMPTQEADDGTRTPWYEGEAGETFRLASKGVWDVPIKIPGGARLHVIASHPTPPAFDGPEARNRRRNHDEIRFVADYIDDATYVIDDKKQPGGLPPGANFVILGDLNADPDEGNAINDPIGALLFGSRHIGPDPRPISDTQTPGLDPDDTALFRLRVDYVLPSRGVRVLRSGVWRHPPSQGPFPSDHFPVWADIAVPAAGEEP